MQRAIIAGFGLAFLISLGSGGAFAAPDAAPPAKADPAASAPAAKSAPHHKKKHHHKKPATECPDCKSYGNPPPPPPPPPPAPVQGCPGCTNGAPDPTNGPG